MQNKEPTISDVLETTNDILEAVSDFASNVEGRFNKIDQRFEKIDQRFEKIDQRFDKMDQRFEKVENDIKTIKSNMVTKSYLDDKLSDFRGDLTVFIRKEDTKVKEELVNILVKKKVLSEKEQKTLFKMKPFAQISV